ncbi:hypothetical protein B7P43_G10931 [Cryptotermes secundus]|uniref:Uncharacterized protein n=1 Tax=Cryptotermes secundus TaxID=105785 RepID=A0A2J7Q9U8_9NEOP|nr:hypothetical protein B7P43_G10931 [Cryptotermes secundus]
MSHEDGNTQILLGYGTINSDETMEHKTQLQRSNSYVQTCSKRFCLWVKTNSDIMQQWRNCWRQCSL